MAIVPLTEKEISRIGSANLVEFILHGVRELEKDIHANKLNLKNPTLSPEQKIRINNLIRLLHILSTRSPYDPLTGKLIFEAKTIIDFIQKLQQKMVDPSLLLLGKKSPQTINIMLDVIVRHVEFWRKEMLGKVIIPIGNRHTALCYHPQFQATYKYKPSILPDDYRSNFFFEAMIKEFCPFTTLIGFHPFSEMQSAFQEKRSLAELTRIDLDVELRDTIAIEHVDNFRAFRVHGAHENKKLPGSYIVVKGGHHRMRALFMKYLKGEVDGNLKVLIQLVKPDTFPLSQGDLFAFVEDEIAMRTVLREQA